MRIPSAPLMCSRDAAESAPPEGCYSWRTGTGRAKGADSRTIDSSRKRSGARFEGQAVMGELAVDRTGRYSPALPLFRVRLLERGVQGDSRGRQSQIRCPDFFWERVSRPRTPDGGTVGSSLAYEAMLVGRYGIVPLGRGSRHHFECS